MSRLSIKKTSSGHNKHPYLSVNFPQQKTPKGLPQMSDYELKMLVEKRRIEEISGVEFFNEDINCRFR